MVTYQDLDRSHALFRPAVVRVGWQRAMPRQMVAIRSSTKPVVAREFYHDKLGLEIATEDEDAIVLTCGGGTHLDVTKSHGATSRTDTASRVIAAPTDRVYAALIDPDALAA